MFFYGSQQIKDFLNRFYIFPAVFVFWKVNILLFSSFLNMIITSLGPWVSDRLSVGRWSVDLIKPFREAR